MKKSYEITTVAKKTKTVLYLPFSDELIGTTAPLSFFKGSRKKHVYVKIENKKYFIGPYIILGEL